MKGIQGLIVAIGLGVAGAMFNWAYLASRSSQEATVSFVGIKEGQDRQPRRNPPRRASHGTENSRTLGRQPQRLGGAVRARKRPWSAGPSGEP